MSHDPIPRDLRRVLSSTECARLRRILARTPRAERYRAAWRFLAQAGARDRAPWL